MPHLTLEYTGNLDFEIQPLLGRLHSELVATGAINLKGLKSRAIRRSEYRIADGNPEYAFVHVNLLIREGRPPQVQREFAQRVMAVLKQTFGDHFENSHLSLSVDIKEMHKGTALSFHNIPEIPDSPSSRPSLTAKAPKKDLEVKRND
jgi:5-carboxymethyl-2-hydroxymuconate isomerase